MWGRCRVPKSSLPSYPGPDPKLRCSPPHIGRMLLPSPSLKGPSSRITLLRIGPIPQASPYLEWSPWSSSLAPNRIGSPLCPTNLSHQELSPKNGGPVPMPPSS